MRKRRFSDTSLCSDDSDYVPDILRSQTRVSKNKGLPQASQKTNKRRNKDASTGELELSPNSACKIEAECDPILHLRSSHTIQSPDSVRVALLRWYLGVFASRGMPWRKPYSPSQGVEERGQRAYEVWVSEVMLQQTQVATVISYYTRWMERFPTIRDLASSTIDEVNALWKGLGYYSRASRLLAGAQKAMERYNGRLPDNAKDMEANIPGIGRYSAGAISSIAYGERVPVLDGNVHRLLSRFLALHAPPKSKKTLHILWAAATDMVQITDPDNPERLANNTDSDAMEHTQYAGDINQALIELGSTVCRVRDPDCGNCPLQPWCRAYDASKLDSTKLACGVLDIEDICNLCEALPGRSEVTSYPMKVDRKKPRQELDIVSVIEWRSVMRPHERWFLLVRRPEGGLLAGLYEFPTSPDVPKGTSLNAQMEMADTLLFQLLQDVVHAYDDGSGKEFLAEDLRIRFIKPVQDVVHVFSHIKKTYRPQWVVLEGGESPPTLRKSNGECNVEITNGGKDGLPKSMWVKLEDISNTNMGTGVVKVWNSTKDLWQNAG